MKKETVEQRAVKIAAKTWWRRGCAGMKPP